MEEKDVLLKTIEGLNASIASLSTTNKNQSEQIKNYYCPLNRKVVSPTP